jgi:hypothetical protein
MSNDAANVFVRKRPAQASLADDRKNKFVKHRDNVDEMRKDTSTHRARIKSREEARARWTGQSAAPRAIGGTPLPPELASQKRASDASRTAPKQPPIVIDIATLRAVVTLWRMEAPDGIALYQTYAESNFNKTSLGNAVEARIAQGQVINPQLAQDAYDDCVQGGHLEMKPRTDREGRIVRLRGEVGQPPPVLFPRTVWPDEVAANEQAKHAAAVKAVEAETQRALNLSFADLQAEVRKRFKPVSPTMANVGS